MLPSNQPSSSKCVHLMPCFTLPPAREDVVEFVAPPLSIQNPVLVVESLMPQTVPSPGTNRNSVVDPLPFLYTGLPELHRPFCNLWERLMKFYKVTFNLVDMLHILQAIDKSDRSKPVVAHSARMIIQHAAAARHPDQLARRECGVVQLQGLVVVVPILPVLGVEPISSWWQISILIVPQPST